MARSRKGQGQGPQGTRSEQIRQMRQQVQQLQNRLNDLEPEKKSPRSISVRTFVAVIVALIMVSVATVAFVGLRTPPATTVSQNHQKSQPTGTSTNTSPIPGAPTTARLVAESGAAKQVSFLGKPTVVEFFATWCQYCAYDAKWSLPTFSQQVQGAGGQVIGVTAALGTGIGQAGPNGNPGAGQDGASQMPANLTSQQIQTQMVAAINQFAKTYSVTDPLYYDPGLVYTTAMKVPGFPYYVFYNAKGQVVTTLTGEQNAAALWTAYQSAK